MAAQNTVLGMAGALGLILPLVIAFFLLIYGVAMGLICIKMAGARNLSKVGFFFLGFFGGFLMIIALALVPKPGQAWVPNP